MIERDLISKEEIVKVFNRKIKPRLGGLETQRNKSLVQACMMSFLVLGLAASAFYQYPDFFTENFAVLIVLSIFFIAGIFRACMYLFRKKFKDEVIEEVFKALIPDCKYSPEAKVSNSPVDDSRLISKNYNRFNGEDYVKGKIGDMDVEFSELHLRKVTGSGKNKKDVKIFKGLFFHFTLNRSLGHNTMIRHDVGEALFGRNIGRFFQKTAAPEGYELVQLESVEFEKKYSVYSDDQIKARVLLTPTVMAGLTSFKKKYKRELEVSIRANKLYVAISSANDHFEPKYFGEVVSLKEIREIYDLILLIHDLQEELELDQAS